MKKIIVTIVVFIMLVLSACTSKSPAAEIFEILLNRRPRLGSRTDQSLSTAESTVTAAENVSAASSFGHVLPECGSGRVAGSVGNAQT